MVFENIEMLKRQFTDKFVVVDESQPELRRFKGQTGTVKTVNMSGRALVEFDAHANTGWYDIDTSFLTVIDSPIPKPEEKKPAKAEKAAKPAAKPTAPAETKAAAEAKAPAVAAKPAASGKQSAADILAAARANKGGAATAPAPSAPPPATKEQAPKSEGVKTIAASDPKKLSMSDILAAARANKGGAPAEPIAPATSPKAAETPKPAAVKAESTPALAPAPQKVDPKSLSVADILAAARGNKTTGSPAPATPAAETKTVPAPKASPAPKTSPPSEAAPAQQRDSAIGKTCRSSCVGHSTTRRSIHGRESCQPK